MAHDLDVKLSIKEYEQQLRAFVVAIKTSLDRTDITPNTKHKLEGKLEAYTTCLSIFEHKFKNKKQHGQQN